MDILYILGGFIGLMIGGNYLVSGAVAVATHWRISPMIIGLTLVGFGTSMPELVTSVQAALIGSPGIAMGNVIGSNIANILLILGVGAMLAPITVARKTLTRDGVVLVVSTMLCLALVLYGSIGRLAGIGLIAVLIFYVIATIVSDRRSGQINAHEPVVSGSQSIALVSLVGGLGVTILAARFLVEGAVSIAAQLGMSETVIGLTVVAVGTSLPELMTTIIAARPWHSWGDRTHQPAVGAASNHRIGYLGNARRDGPFDLMRDDALACQQGRRCRADPVIPALRWRASLRLSGHVAYSLYVRDHFVDLESIARVRCHLKSHCLGVLTLQTKDHRAENQLS